MTKGAYTNLPLFFLYNERKDFVMGGTWYVSKIWALIVENESFKPIKKLQDMFLVMKLKNRLHTTIIIAITYSNRYVIIIEFFPKSFDASKILTYRGVLLSDDWDGHLQLKNSWVIPLWILILEILPHVFTRCDVDDSRSNFLWYGIENLYIRQQDHCNESMLENGYQELMV